MNSIPSKAEANELLWTAVPVFKHLKSFTVSSTLYQLFVVRLIKVLRVGWSLLNSTPSTKNKYINEKVNISLLYAVSLVKLGLFQKAKRLAITIQKLT